MKKKELSWKPVRRGSRYCSTACGRGCTYKEFLAAKKAGERLCKQLGPGWKPRIWENMGWHYSALFRVGDKFRFEVREYSSDDYWADLGVANQQFERTGKTAREAMWLALQDAIACVAGISAGLAALSNRMRI